MRKRHLVMVIQVAIMVWFWVGKRVKDVTAYVRDLGQFR